jgi:hypothetical protein
MKIFKQIIYYPMLSWRLWQQLHQPPEHPVFWRTLKLLPKYQLPASILWLILLVTIAVSYVIGIYLVQFEVPIMILWLTMLASFSCAYMVIWIIHISQTIAREQQQATYDPICMTPSGAMGANWAFATGILHRGDRLHWIDFGRKLLSGLFLLILLMALLTITFREGLFTTGEPLQLFLEIALFTLMSYIDHVQALVLGVLIAMLVPIAIRNATDVHIWAVFIFITLQVFTLTTLVLVSQLMLSHMVGYHWQFSAMLFLLYGLREGLIHFFWKILSYQLNAESSNALIIR